MHAWGGLAPISRAHWEILNKDERSDSSEGSGREIKGAAYIFSRKRHETGLCEHWVRMSVRA